MALRTGSWSHSSAKLFEKQMTIKGLNSIVNKTLIRTTLHRLKDNFGIKVLIVDAYSWLHAGKHITGVVELLSCNLLCPPLNAFIERRISTLSLNGAFQIILVFDGPSSKSKHNTDKERQAERLTRRKEGLDAQAEGDYEKSTSLLRSAVDITPDIAAGVIEYLNELPAKRKRAIGLRKCIVSINEADPMLAHLNRNIADSCVVSNDYDALPWNVQKCLFKVDYYTGFVHLFMRQVFDVSAVVSRQLLQVSHHQLIDICVMAGCDYVKSLKNEGFIKSANNIRKYGSAVKVIRQWKKEGRPDCTNEYMMAVRGAISMYRHCWIVDEVTDSVKRLNPVPNTAYYPFDPEKFLDPRPDLATAIGVHRGELHPNSLLKKSNGSNDHTMVTPPDTVSMSASVEPHGCTDPELMKKFHLKAWPPYDRAMTKSELQKLLVLPEAEVPHSGIFSAKGKYDRKTTLKLFKIWRRRGGNYPKHGCGKLKLFLRTRGKTVGSASRQELICMCEQVLRDEASHDRAIRLTLTPYDDGAAEKRRRQALADAGILTAINAPGLVPPKRPRLTDPRWQMISADVLKEADIIFPDVLMNWLSLFTKNFSSLMLKAQGAWSSGKAYSIKYMRINDFLFVYSRVGQSYSNASSKAYNVRVQ